MKKIVIACVLMVCADGLWAAEWKGGGSDAKWSNVENWTKGAKPTTTDAVYVKDGVKGDIELDEDVTVSRLLLKPGTDIRLIGTGKLALTYDGTGALYFYAEETASAPGGRLVIDGATIDCRDYPKSGFSIRPGTELEVRAGAYLSGMSGSTGWLGGTLRVTGGTFVSRRLNRSEASQVVQTGGYLQCNVMDGDLGSSSTQWTYTGGTFVPPAASISTFDRWPDRSGKTLIVRNTDATAVSALNAAGAYRLDGSLYVTNDWEVGTHQLVNMSTAPATLAGCGALYANGLKTGNSATDIIHYGVPTVRLAAWTTGKDGGVAETHNGVDFGVYGDDFTQVDGLSWRFNGLTTFDTADCFAPGTVRNYTLTDFLPGDAAGIRLKGTGSFSWALGGNLAGCLFSRVEATDSGSLALERDGGSFELAADAVKLGAGATLTLSGSNVRLKSKTRAAEIGAGAVLNVTVTGTLKAGYRYNVLDAGPFGDVSGLTFGTVSLPSGWRLEKANGCVYLADDTMPAIPMDTTKTPWYFLGKTANWSETQNWNITKKNPDQTKVPGKNATVKFCSLSGTIVSNDTDEVISVDRMEFVDACGPVVFRGAKGFELTQASIRSSTTAVILRGAAQTAVTFEAPVTSPCATFDVCPTQGSLSFLGGFSLVDGTFYYVGDVRFGGSSTIRNLFPFSSTSYYGEASDPCEITLTKDAVLDVTEQTNDFNNISYWRIGEGAKLSFQPFETGSLVVNTAMTALVEGALDVGVPFTVARSATSRFHGGGALTLSQVVADPETDGVVEIGEGLTLYGANDWKTTAAGNGGTTLALHADSAVTIGAKADWSYGPAAGVTPTSAARTRALVSEGLYAPLTIDTQDPVGDIGHTVRFVDPIVAGGDVTKTGNGTLVLCSSENSLSNRFALSGGCLRLAAPQTVGEFAAAAGTTLSYDAMAGSLATLNVLGGDVDLTGVTIDLTEAARGAAGNGGVLIRVPTGSSILGTPELAGTGKLKIKVAEDGSSQLLFAPKLGLVITIW